MDSINDIKAYVLGLLVGGGKIDGNTFVIDLPYKKWGMDPTRMSSIATSILTNICDRFNRTYRFNVTYEIGNLKWLIKPVGKTTDITELLNDLQYLGLPIGGTLLSTADLVVAKSKLQGVAVESFLSGIFDARASLTASHRRFSDDAPIVSIEVPGKTRNFRFVVQLCGWLTDLGSVTDQILYNHPNQHSGSDPYYGNWKKGFKIRFLAKSFLQKHSFALEAKAFDIVKIEKRQQKEEQPPCPLRKIRKPKQVSIHMDQGSDELPSEVKNKAFFHYFHICAEMGCPYAPLDEVKQLVSKKSSLINFFPRLMKGNRQELTKHFLSIQQLYFPSIALRTHKRTVARLMESDKLKGFEGFKQGLAYLFSASLKGKRHLGPMTAILEQHSLETLSVTSIGESFDSPLLVVNETNDRAFICSAVYNQLNQKLISERTSIDGLAINIISG